MTRSSAPGTGISRAHSSGTRLSPIRRAATAGNSASRSCVSVKMQDTRSSAPSPLRSRIACISSSVAVRIASPSLSVTVVAPRSAIIRMGGALSTSGLAEPLHLDAREPAMGALLEPAQPQRAEGDALEVDHRVPHRLEHAAHLALAALVDRDLHLVRRDPAGPRRPRAAVVELHALAQRPEGGLTDR